MIYFVKILVIFGVFISQADAKLTQFLFEHLTCPTPVNSFNKHLFNTSKECKEASYMSEVHDELSSLSSTKESFTENYLSVAILNSILTLYEDLSKARTPSVVNLGTHFHNSTKHAVIYPISSCIPEESIISTIAPKTKAFGHSVSGIQTHYHLSNVSHSYEDVESSYFVLAQKAATGWDSPKNLETLALGSIPIYLSLRHCPHSALTAHPKILYQHLLKLPGLEIASPSRHNVVSVHNEQVKANISFINKQLYHTVVSSLLQFARNVLTTTAMSTYILDTIITDSKLEVNYTQNIAGVTVPTVNVLYLTHVPHTHYKDDFMTDLILHGLKRLLTKSIVTDYPRREALYYDSKNVRSVTNNTTKNTAKNNTTTTNSLTWNLKLSDIQHQVHSSDSALYYEEVRAGIISHKYDLVIFASDHHRDELTPGHPNPTNTATTPQQTTTSATNKNNKVETKSGAKSDTVVSEKRRQLWSFFDLFSGSKVNTPTNTNTTNTNTIPSPPRNKDSARLAKDKQYTDLLSLNTKNTTKRSPSKITTTPHTTSSTLKSPLDPSKVEFHDLVCAHYSPSHVAYVDGSEHHISKRLLERYSPCVGHFFSREGYNEVV